MLEAVEKEKEQLSLIFAALFWFDISTTKGFRLSNYAGKTWKPT